MTKDKKFPEDKEGKNTSKGKKPRSGKRHRSESYDFEKPRRNDVQDYFGSDQLKKDVFSVPFGQLSGTTAPYVYQWPTLVQIQFHPVTIPADNRASNAATQAARALYQWIRHENSGSTNYDAPDLELYELALTDIIVNIKWAKQIYKFLNTFMQDRRDVPTDLLASLGISAAYYPAWQQGIALFRGRLNFLIRKLSQYAIPADIPVTKVESYLLSYCFRDKDDVRSQFYYYAPKSYLIFKPTKYSTGGCLERRAFTSGTYINPDTLLNVIEDQINAINSDEDMNIMSGDILKAYKRNEAQWKLFQFEEIDENAIIEFKHDPDILNRIHHLSPTSTSSYSQNSQRLFVGDIIQSSDGIIKMIIGGSTSNSYTASGITFSDGVINIGSTWTEDSTFKTMVLDGNIYNYFTFSVSTTNISNIGVLKNQVILDFDHMPSSDELIEATRHMACFTFGTVTIGSGTYNCISDSTYGSEIIYDVFVTNVLYNGTVSHSHAEIYGTAGTAEIASFSAMDNFPMNYYSQGSTPFDTNVRYGGHLDYISKLPFSQLKMANEIALFTELSLNSVLKIV